MNTREHFRNTEKCIPEGKFPVLNSEKQHALLEGRSCSKAPVSSILCSHCCGLPASTVALLAGIQCGNSYQLCACQFARRSVKDERGAYRFRT